METLLTEWYWIFLFWRLFWPVPTLKVSPLQVKTLMVKFEQACGSSSSSAGVEQPLNYSTHLGAPGTFSSRLKVPAPFFMPLIKEYLADWWNIPSSFKGQSWAWPSQQNESKDIQQVCIHWWVTAAWKDIYTPSLQYHWHHILLCFSHQNAKLGARPVPQGWKDNDANPPWLCLQQS